MMNAICQYNQYLEICASGEYGTMIIIKKWWETKWMDFRFVAQVLGECFMMAGKKGCVTYKVHT